MGETGKNPTEGIGSAEESHLSPILRHWCGCINWSLQGNMGNQAIWTIRVGSQRIAPG